MNRILLCVPRDARAEVKEVLEVLMREGETDIPAAALLYLVRSYKLEILAAAEAKRRHRAAQ
jgi:hypothetical protein